MTSAQMEAVLSAYKTLAKIPSVVSGRLNEAGTRANVVWSTRNLDKGRSIKYRYDYILNKDLDVVAESDFGIDCSTELLSAISPTERFRAVIREEKDKEKKKQYLEVWERNQLAHSIDLTAVDLHGDVYTEAEFATLEWSPDEAALLYVAERRPPPAESYVKRRAAKEEPDAKDKLVGEEYVHREDWGEQLGGRRRAACVRACLRTETLAALAGLPDSHCPGQLLWAEDGASVFGVAYETEPERLGLVFCTNRPAYVFQLTLDGELTRLTPAHVSAGGPRRAAGGLLWLQRGVGGPHHACLQLARYDLATRETTIIVDTVETSRAVVGGSLRGLYSPLPRRTVCGDRAVLHTQRATEVRAYVVHIPTGEVTELPAGADTDADADAGTGTGNGSGSGAEFRGSVYVLDVSGGVVLAVRSSLTQPPELVAARLPARGGERGLRWRRLAATPAPAGLAAAACDRLTHTHAARDDDDDSPASFTSLWLRLRGAEGGAASGAEGGAASGAEGGAAPLIVWPHGGPHSAFADAWSLEAALYLLSGFMCVLVNYRGSTGAGERALRSLLGRAGGADVADCRLAADDVLARCGARAVCVSGGSHGGFLAAHLCGQHPGWAAAAALRNPVIDVVALRSVSDIPDWSAVEAGFPYTEAGPVSEEHLLAMRRCSPLAHAHRVTAPTALMLGSGDRRVPSSQGLEYARRLRANRVETKVYMYDDNHSLSSLPHEADHVLNVVRWFLTHAVPARH